MFLKLTGGQNQLRLGDPGDQPAVLVAKLGVHHDDRPTDVKRCGLRVDVARGVAGGPVSDHVGDLLADPDRERLVHRGRRPERSRRSSRGVLRFDAAVPTGFEPAISSLTGTYARPLHHGTVPEIRAFSRSHSPVLVHSATDGRRTR